MDKMSPVNQITDTDHAFLVKSESRKEESTMREEYLEFSKASAIAKPLEPQYCPNVKHWSDMADETYVVQPGDTVELMTWHNKGCEQIEGGKVELPVGETEILFRMVDAHQSMSEEERMMHELDPFSDARKMQTPVSQRRRDQVDEKLIRGARKCKEKAETIAKQNMRRNLIKHNKKQQFLEEFRVLGQPTGSQGWPDSVRMKDFKTRLMSVTLALEGARKVHLKKEELAFEKSQQFEKKRDAQMEVIEKESEKKDEDEAQKEDHVQMDQRVSCLVSF